MPGDPRDERLGRRSHAEHHADAEPGGHQQTDEKQAGEGRDLMDTLISKNFLDLFGPFNKHPKDVEKIAVALEREPVLTPPAIEISHRNGNGGSSQ